MAGAKHIAAACWVAPLACALITGRLACEQLPITAYTTAEGLVHNHINRIRQDSRGYLWFCTDGGLSRFDGYRFTNYTTEDGLPHPWVNDLLEARDGSYWIATDGGVCRFNPRGRSARLEKHEGENEPMFRVYHPAPERDASRVNALAEDSSGRILCATYAGLYRFQPKQEQVTFQPVDIGLPRNAIEGLLVNDLALDQQGTFWIGASHGLFRLFADGRSERYTRADGLPDDFIGPMFRARNGRWWIGTRTGGLCSLVKDPQPGQRLVEHCYSVAEGLPRNDVRAIFESSNGKLWIGSLGGLSEFDPSTSRFRNFTAANGLSAAVIYVIQEDRDANLWIGTRDTGVMKMAGNGFVRYGERDGIITGNADSIITEDSQGKLCVITTIAARGFVDRFDGSRFTATEIALPRRRTDANALWLRSGFEDRYGEWWIATTGRLYRFPKNSGVQDLEWRTPRIYDSPTGPGEELFDQVYQDSRGDVWFATGGQSQFGSVEYALTRWNRGNQTFHRFAGPDVPTAMQSHGVTAMREDGSGNLWIGLDHDGGVARYRRGRLEMVKPDQEAFHGEIRAIFRDHAGRLWIASTQGGVGRIDNPDSERPQVTRYTVATGLSSNEIRCVTEDRYGRVYLGTNRGVDRLDPPPKDLGNAAVQVGVRHYTWADGLPRGTVDAAFQDRRGDLWFGTNDGVSRFAPLQERAPLSPSTLITSIRIMGVAQNLSEVGEAQVGNLTLAPSRNDIEIEYVSLDFKQGVELRYQYMLEGAGRTWSAPTDQRRVLYPGLSPGAYRFLVRAVSSDGHASSQAATVTFTLLAPVWRRWWFIALEAGVVGLVIYQLFRYRLAQLLKLERVRTRIATDLHDDIGSSLSQIAILSEVVQRRLAAPEQEIQEPLARIAGVSRELIDSMSDIVWAINPAKDRVHFLNQRMREFAGDVLEAKGIELRFECEEEEHDHKIGAEVRRQVFLIFKECIHNIIRHSDCTAVEIRLRADDRRLRILISDNGSNFEPPVEETGHGLRSMRERARGLRGQIEITPQPRGTLVTLEIPLGKAPILA